MEKVDQNFKQAFLHSKLGLFLRKLLIFGLNWVDITGFNSKSDRNTIYPLLRQIRKETELLITDDEGYQIYSMVAKTGKIPGEIAEVGAYKGGSTKLICEAKGQRSLYVFDTFAGLPAPEESDVLYKTGQFSSSFEQVRDYLKGYPKVFLYKGIFPATSKPVDNIRFSFVHIDVDLYRSTLDCLNYFYPRINAGGAIISHDYGCAPGVKKAVDEFFAGKPEVILDNSGCQCLIIKVNA